MWWIAMSSSYWSNTCHVFFSIFFKYSFISQSTPPPIGTLTRCLKATTSTPIRFRAKRTTLALLLSTRYFFCFSSGGWRCPKKIWLDCEILLFNGIWKKSKILCCWSLQFKSTHYDNTGSMSCSHDLYTKTFEEASFFSYSGSTTFLTRVFYFQISWTIF